MWPLWAKLKMCFIGYNCAWHGSEVEAPRQNVRPANFHWPSNFRDDSEYIRALMDELPVSRRPTAEIRTQDLSEVSESDSDIGDGEEENQHAE